MNASDIKDICINGSQAYYNFLSNKKNGGVEEVEIQKIKRINESTYKIKVSKKLFEVDSICFRYNGKISKTYSGEAIRVKVYDNSKRTVVVKVSPEVGKYISDCNHLQWKIIIDLKFLIQRVIDWYKENGNNLILHNKPTSSNKFDKSVIFKEEGFLPSTEQLDAIKMVFSNHLSYVWGAPGTGKTMFVLSYSILSYVKKKQKVLVLAPTNVALEQVLTGVMEMTGKAGLDRKKVLRLGYPSQSFANKFGEICEIQGLEKELNRIKEQIEILSSILGLENSKEKELRSNIELITELISKLNELSALKHKVNDLSNKIEVTKKDIRSCDSRLDVIQMEIEHLVKKKNSIVGKLFGFISSKVDYEKEINILISNKESIENKSSQSYQLGIKYQSEFDKLDTLKVSLESEIEEYRSLFSEDAKDNCTNVSVLESFLSAQKKALKKEEENHEVYRSLAKEYKDQSDVQLKMKLEEYQTEEKRLSNYSLEARLEKAMVVGATIDTFIHRYKDKTPNFSHIFIDEAGYASVVKALTVFTTKTPITLLGDHMQLPPVCEISKSDIKKDSDIKSVFTWDMSAIFISDFWNASNEDEALQVYFNSTTPSDKKLEISALKASHRFGPNLAGVLDKYVYKTGFKSSEKKVSKTEIVICNVANPHKARIGTRWNQSEAIAIQKYIETQFDKEDSVAVLAPYRAQIDNLKKLIPDFKDEDKILTVHKSQGREWDTVIYSVCDIGNGKYPWFTDSTSKISNGINNVNTAVSRAKERLVIFCSIDEWNGRDDQLISGLISARTDLVNIDSSQFEFKRISKIRPKAIPVISSTSNNTESSLSSGIKGSKYVPVRDDEEWESKKLYWSKLEKKGYKYSTKKDAWWKSK